jgi:hypothetical protein
MCLALPAQAATPRTTFAAALADAVSGELQEGLPAEHTARHIKGCETAECTGMLASDDFHTPQLSLAAVMNHTILHLLCQQEVDHGGHAVLL